MTQRIPLMLSIAPKVEFFLRLRRQGDELGTFWFSSISSLTCCAIDRSATAPPWVNSSLYSKLCLQDRAPDLNLTSFALGQEIEASKWEPEKIERMNFSIFVNNLIWAINRTKIIKIWKTDDGYRSGNESAANPIPHQAPIQWTVYKLVNLMNTSLFMVTCSHKCCQIHSTAHTCVRFSIQSTLTDEQERIEFDFTSD